MPRTNNLLFVYGTLLHDSNHEMAVLLRENSTPLGEATLKGTLYKIAWYPGVVIDERVGTHVYGELVALHDMILLAPLDEFEGIGGNASKPYEYVRKEVEVMTVDGPVLAWCYVYNHSVEGRTVIKSGRFTDALE